MKDFWGNYSPPRRRTPKWLPSAVVVAGSCLFGVGVLLGDVPAQAKDGVHLTSPTNPRAKAKIEGEILDFTGKSITVRLPGGNDISYPAQRVASIDFEKSPAHLQGDEHYVAKSFKEALESYGNALENEEKRDWVRREIQARMIRSLQALDRHEEAARIFLALVKSDPSTPHFAVIPLTYSLRDLGADGTKWAELLPAQEGTSPEVSAAGKLLAADRLLAGPSQERGVKIVQELSRHADPRVAAIAQGLLWNSRAATVNLDTVQQWEKESAAYPAAYCSGIHFAIGKAWSRLGKHEEAALRLMHIVIHSPQERLLGEQALLETGLLLEKMKRGQEAVEIYRELLREFSHQPTRKKAEAGLERSARLSIFIR